MEVLPRWRHLVLEGPGRYAKPVSRRSRPCGSGSLDFRRGDVAQLVEHLLCKQGVGGSSPLVSTEKSADPVVRQFIDGRADGPLPVW